MPGINRMPGINTYARYQYVCQVSIRMPGINTYLGGHFPSKLAEKHVPAIKKSDLGTQSRQSTAAIGASQSGVRPAARTHPSTRAGDQDDVS